MFPLPPRPRRTRYPGASARIPWRLHCLRSGGFVFCCRFLSFLPTALWALSLSPWAVTSWHAWDGRMNSTGVKGGEVRSHGQLMLTQPAPDLRACACSQVCAGAGSHPADPPAPGGGQPSAGSHGPPVSEMCDVSQLGALTAWHRSMSRGTLSGDLSLALHSTPCVQLLETIPEGRCAW